MQTLRETTALTNEQVSIYENKYAAPQICKLSDEELIKSVRKILFRISVITGWVLPTEKFILEMLYSDLFKKLKEDYEDLNFEEIAYAVRKNESGIKDWGKTINLLMLDEVLIPYKSKRLEISKIEEWAALKIKNKNALQLPEPVNYEEMIETVKSIFLKTKLIGLIPVPVYDILVSKNELELNEDEKKVIRSKVEAMLCNQAYSAGLSEIREYKSLKDNKSAYELRVRNECKKHAVAEYFIKQHEIDNF